MFYQFRIWGNADFLLLPSCVTHPPVLCPWWYVFKRGIGIKGGSNEKMVGKNLKNNGNDKCLKCHSFI
jgi:hypothetical protein